MSTAPPFGLLSRSRSSVGAPVAEPAFTHGLPAVSLRFRPAPSMNPGSTERVPAPPPVEAAHVPSWISCRVKFPRPANSISMSGVLKKTLLLSVSLTPVPKKTAEPLKAKTLFLSVTGVSCGPS